MATPQIYVFKSWRFANKYIWWDEVICAVDKMKIDMWKRRSHSYYGDHRGWNLPLLKGDKDEITNYWLNRAYPNQHREKLEPRCYVTQDISDETFESYDESDHRQFYKFDARALVFFEPGLRLDPFKGEFWPKYYCNEAWRNAYDDLERERTKAKVVRLTLLSERCEYKIERGRLPRDRGSNSTNRFAELEEICDRFVRFAPLDTSWLSRREAARCDDLAKFAQWLNPSKTLKRQVIKSVARHFRRIRRRLTDSERNFFTLFAGAAALSKMLRGKQNQICNS